MKLVLSVDMLIQLMFALMVFNGRHVFGLKRSGALRAAKVVFGSGQPLTRRTALTLSDAYQGESGWEPDFSKYKEAFGDLEIANSQWDALEEMSARLFDWNSKINLVSRKDVENLIPSHIVPCMTMAKVRRFWSNERIIDIGTGGGLPGLPMAILCPDAQFTLLDSVGKKLLVVEDISKALKLDNVVVVNDRAENYAQKGNSFDFLMGRAVSNLPHFLTFSCDLLRDDSDAADSGLLYLKGGDFRDEIANAGVKEYSLHKVQDMAKIESDKKILRIPAGEITSFRSRKDKIMDWLAREKQEAKARKAAT